MGKYISIEMLIKKTKGLSKTDRVRVVIENRVGKITKKISSTRDWGDPSIVRLTDVKPNVKLNQMN